MPAPELARIDFPVHAARRFVLVFFGVLGALLLVWLLRALSAPAFADTSRTPLLVLGGIFAVMIGGGFLAALFVVGRRPTAMVARPEGLLLCYGTKETALAWSQIEGLDQQAIRRVPTHVVLIARARPLAFGLGPKAQDMARHIARQADLVWIDEPFKARRPG